MLSEQATTLVPDDFSQEEKEFVIKVVYNFCYLAGEALAGDTKLNFNVDQCCIVTQFIGEWSFHKSIDILRSKLPENIRDGSLQKIAFTVFEIAKQAIISKIPQDDMVRLVEAHVTKTYNETLDDYGKKGLLTLEIVENAKHHSNLDDMAKSQDPKIEQHIENHAPNQQVDTPSQTSSKPQKTQNNAQKVLKLATLALVLRKMPHDKISSIISKFSQEDASTLIQYINTPDLEVKLDRQIALKCLKEIKTTIPSSMALNPSLLNSKIHKLVNKTDKNKILSAIRYERQRTKDFVLGMYDNFEIKMPPRVQEIIYN